MNNVYYTPSFLRQFKKLEPSLREEVSQKIKLFREDPKNHQLKTHRLKGRLKGSSNFSVNYQYRIIFETLSANEFALTAIGNHDIYK
ncbi:MAG: type II toxin-antitoxin system RelE/ParE family toxin [Candidatus Peregrinibacteria bacterium]|nr:type II toxin-antitoxin system RelE/ParE family toxin [Candidatus Peregrinibacteria bacterium]